MSVSPGEQLSPLSDEQLRLLYAWIDAIPLTRPKRNIARDFADGVMLAEVVAAYFPTLVELHNYAAANSVKQKVYNFETLNQRVLRKLGYQIPRPLIDDIVACRPGAVEGVLNALQLKMAKYREKRANGDVQSVGDSVSPSSQPHYQQPKTQQQLYQHQPQQQQQYQQQSQAQAQAQAQAQPQPQQPSSGSARDSRRGQQQQQSGIHPQNGRGGGAVQSKPAILAAVDDEILLEKEQQIRELQETVEILELKIAKLEQLVRLKDNKIQKLMGK